MMRELNMQLQRLQAELAQVRKALDEQEPHLLTVEQYIAKLAKTN
jgi:hypothetical protein